MKSIRCRHIFGQFFFYSTTLWMFIFFASNAYKKAIIARVRAYFVCLFVWNDTNVKVIMRFHWDLFFFVDKRNCWRSKINKSYDRQRVKVIMVSIHPLHERWKGSFSKGKQNKTDSYGLLKASKRQNNLLNYSFFFFFHKNINQYADHGVKMPLVSIERA